MLQDIQNYDDPEIGKLVRQRHQRSKLLFDKGPPEALLGDYELSLEGLARSALMQQRFTSRRENIERCWTQAQLYLPEVLTAPPQDVLEISTGHGAMLELLRHYGHNVMGTDYARTVWSSGAFSDAVKPDWPYRHVVESIDLPMTVFDGRLVPYPFANDSYDVVMCLQAIDHFGHPDDWMPLIDEYCRISRKTVLVLLTPPATPRRIGSGYEAAFRDFQLGLSRFRRSGFVCTGVFLHQEQPLGFKLSNE